MGHSKHGSGPRRIGTELICSVPVDMQCTILVIVLDGINTRDQVDDVTAYFANRDTKNYSQLLSQRLEKRENTQTVG